MQAINNWRQEVEASELTCFDRAYFLGRGSSQREQIIKPTIDPGQP